ncbi:MAG: hypothetical protein ACE5SW_11930 [Nitrososphaeraceae archaeon]
MNSKIKTGSMLVLAAVLVAGTISMTIPSSFAEPGVNIQKIKCVNSNTNINGVNVNQFPDLNGEAGTQQLQENGPENGNGNGLLGDGGLNIDRNLVNICLDINANGQFSGDRLPPILEK